MGLPRFSVTFPTIIIIITFIHIAPTTSDRLLQQYKNQTQLPSPSPITLQLPAVPAYNITFAEYKAAYGKRYSSVAEENYRFHVFRANLRRMNEHNRNASRTYNMKPNHFLDVTSSEFKQHFTGTYKSDSHSRNVSHACLHSKDAERREKHNHFNKNATRSNHNEADSDFEEEATFRNASSAQNMVNNQNIDNSTNSFSRLLMTVQNSSESAQLSSNAVNSYPSSIMIDWSIYAGSIKYQGLCGACYAFTAVDTLAAANAIHKYSFFISLSVQQILDCSNNGLTFGCSGGFLEGAFTYIQLNGVNTQQAYPYTSATTAKAGKCEQNGGPFKLSSFDSIAEGDCDAVINSLRLGPVSAGIAGYNLQFYDTGVFNDCNQVLDHAVVIIGYKSGFGWRIKNSWGLQWGEEGFGWIAEGNTCGICNMAVSIIA